MPLIACAAVLPTWAGTPGPAGGEKVTAAAAVTSPEVAKRSAPGPYEQMAIRRGSGEGSNAVGASGATGTGASTGGAGPGGAKVTTLWELGRVPLALLGVLALVLALKAVWRRVIPGADPTRAGRAIQVLTRTPISPRQQLMLVRVGRRLVLVGNSGSELNALCEIDDPDEVAQLVAESARENRGSAAALFRGALGAAARPYGGQSAAVDRERAADADAETEAALDEEPTRAASAPGAANVDLPARGSGAGDAASLSGAVGDPRSVMTRDELSGLMDRVRKMSRKFQ